ncbi:MAG: MBOAT family O-acyltransferase [Chitinophagales bacterium]
MVFNSPVFAVFLIIVFTLYWFVFNKNVKLQNLFIVIASYFFYGWWDWRFLSLLFISSIVDFSTAWYMNQTADQRKRKILLAISLITNLGMLGVFKYYDFFITSFTNAFATFGIQLNANTLNIILPVGISFYTFQTLSYTIEVFRKNLAPTKDFIAFSAFISFFPQLVAGPIERATRLLPQFYKPRIFNFRMASSGLQLMLWGFFKKIVIADNLSGYVDTVYNDPQNFHGIPVVISTICFAIQIYCDFSGYSDIAIGCARLFGFDLMKNFDAPYFSTSPKEFWRRWHISLSTWFRDYVYVPLGGNRSTFGRVQFNLMLTFLVSGLWHGANWTFLIWGGLHGAAVCLENIFDHRKIKLHLNKYVAGSLLFLFVCFVWIFFRASNIEEAWMLIGNIFHSSSMAEWQAMFNIKSKLQETWPSLILFILLEILIRKTKARNFFSNRSTTIRWACYYGIIIWILIFGALNNPPSFIYFQF